MLAGAAVLSTRSVVNRAETQRHRWGTTAVVAVMAADVDAGSVVAASDVALRSFPVALVPPLASSTVNELVGLRAVSGLRRGDLVIAPRLVRGRSSVTAQLSSDERAVAIALGPVHAPMSVGDLVELVPTAGRAVPGTVLAVQDDSVTVAVPSADSAALATAGLAGRVAVIIRP